MTPEKFSIVEQQVRDIHHAVIGSESLGQEGLVKKVERHERWIQDAKVRIGMIVGGTLTIGFLLNFAMKFVGK